VEFQGKMRLLADPLNVVGADLEVGEGSVALIVSNHEVGEWRLDEVAVEMQSDGFHLQVDGEEFIFMTPARSQLAEALGVGAPTRPAATKPDKAKRRRPESRADARRQPKPPRTRRQSKPPRARREWRIDLSDRRLQVLGGLLLVTVALGVVARGLLTALLLFAGISGVVIGGAAILDPLLAARLPQAMTPTKWAVAGLGATAGGMILLLI
jgi:hypothetical protein